MERLIGKHGFAQSARPCLKSIFEQTYIWLAEQRAERPGPSRGMVELPGGVWLELMMSAMLLPNAQFNLSAGWSTRVEASDSSMSGLGRALSTLPRHVVQTVARFCDHQNVYTNLKLPWGIGLDEHHRCPLRKVKLPIDKMKWKYCGVPWTPIHITHAAVWGIDDRHKHNMSVEGERYVRILDSAAMVGALSKGRSSSHLINKRCRKVTACNVAGNADGFYPWTPSADNPADQPSRWFEPVAKVGLPQPELAAAEPTVDLSRLPLLDPDDTESFYFLHLCSGPYFMRLC